MVWDKVAENLPVIFKCLKYLIKLIKGSKDKPIKPENQEEINKILPSLEKAEEIPKIWQKKEFREFFENYDFIEKEGLIWIIPRKILEQEAIPILKQNKDKQTDKKIDIISLRENKNFYELRTLPKHPKGAISEIFPFLNNRYQSLLNLAIYVDNLYEKNRKEDAGNIKRDIKQRYGEEGLRFCNCYQRGYIERIMLKGSRYEVNERLDKFLKRPIFFVYSEMSEEDLSDVKRQIALALNNKQNYIAIHSLGGAIYYAKEILDEIEEIENIGDSEYESEILEKKKVIGKEKKKINDFSKIWFLESGKELYDLIRDLL